MQCKWRTKNLIALGELFVSLTLNLTQKLHRHQWHLYEQKLLEWPHLKHISATNL